MFSNPPHPVRYACREPACPSRALTSTWIGKFVDGTEWGWSACGGKVTWSKGVIDKQDQRLEIRFMVTEAVNQIHDACMLLCAGAHGGKHCKVAVET